MKYAIELYFNQKMEEKINSLAAKIAEQGISTNYLEWKTRPHLTLACFRDVDEEKCKNQLKAFAENHCRIPAGLGSVGMFVETKTIFLAPVMTSAMYQFQRELHETLTDFDTTGYAWYTPDRWVPHCTIALTGEDREDAFYRAGDLVLHEFERLDGEFVSVGLVKISFPVEEICTFALN